MNKSRMLTVACLVAAVMAVVAIAWACNPQSHQMTTVSTIYYPTGPTSVLVEGYCDTTSADPCAGNSNMNLYQDTQVSTEVKELTTDDDHDQSTCTTSDTDIGDLKYLANGKSFTNDGTATAVTSSPGNFVVCAGMDTSTLWDNIVIL